MSYSKSWSLLVSLTSGKHFTCDTVYFKYEFAMKMVSQCNSQRTEHSVIVCM